MADENSISSLADAFREQRYLTYAEEELSPARDNFGRWFGTPYGYVADPDEGLPDELFGRVADVASSAAGNGGKEEAAKEPEEPHWVITEIEDSASSNPTYESAEKTMTDRRERAEDIIRRNKLPIRISSYGRKPGEAGNAGDQSWHTKSDAHGAMAFDVVAASGHTLEEALPLMAACDEWVDFLKDEGMSVIEELTPEQRKKYGATGANLHHGYDSGGEKADSYYARHRAAARRGGRLERGLEYMRMLRQYGQ